jgi:hypothetical protein
MPMSRIIGLIFFDNIEPLFNKVKKDGTMSKENLYVSLTNATIELVKE